MDPSQQSSWDQAELRQMDSMFPFILPMGKLSLKRLSNFSIIPQLLSGESRIEIQVCLTPEPIFFTTKFSGSLITVEK